MRAGWKLPKARKFVMILGAAMMPVAILAPRVPGAALAIAATCFLTMGHAFWISNMQALPTDICRAGEIGTVMGISGMGGTVGRHPCEFRNGLDCAAFYLRPGIFDGRTDAPARGHDCLLDAAGQAIRRAGGDSVLI